MKKYIFKIIIKLLFEAMSSVNYGYEMGCLISSEFTPAPDYTYVRKLSEKLCKKYGYTHEEFMQWVDEKCINHKHPFQSHWYSQLFVEEMYN